MRILTVVGARPQFVKAAVVSREIRRRREGGADLHEDLVHTGQHYDRGMSQVFFEQMDIPAPAAHLGVGSGSHGAQTGAMLAAVEAEIQGRQPDVVLVYGDTNSTIAGALAAAKLHVPVAHVEAGLRSFNRKMPEEVNRVLTDHCSTWLFCPAAASAAQLAREGITDGVHVVGDVMVDALLHYRNRAERPPRPQPFALATIHRAENTDDPARLRTLIRSLCEAPLPVVLPLHPRTKAALEREGLAASGALQCVPPLSYFEILGHLDACAFVLTDSGGLQKEAYVFGKRCVTLRDETEWTELVDVGGNRVVGADADRIRAAMAWAATPLTDAPPVYGAGDAGVKIVDFLAQ